jgi:putative ABC transport system permease protein
MANLVLAAITIKGAVNESTAYAKNSLGGTVYLQADMAKLRENTPSQTGDSQPDQTARTRFERPTISVALVEDIAASDYVKDYTYGVNTTANAGDFTVVETDETEMRGAYNQMRGNPPNGTDSGETPAFMQRGDITINGVNSYAFISEVKNGAMTIAGGTYFDEKTDDKVMISQDLATQNNLAVGDKITLKTTADSVEKTLEIIGLYDITDENFGANTIYMNIATAAKFLSTDDYKDGSYSVDNVQYFLTSAEYADQFIAEASSKHPELAENSLALQTDTSAYEQMVAPIESVGSFATTIIWVVVVARVVIITLIVTINVKDRRYEMGVLMSLGAKRTNILGQIFIELVMVGTLAFALSIGTSQFLAQGMGDGLLKSQIAASQTESEQNFGRPGTAPTGGRMGGGGFNQRTSRTSVEAIDTINISASPSDYLILFAAGYAVIILALILPSVNVLRYEPKTILSGKE